MTAYREYKHELVEAFTYKKLAALMQESVEQHLREGWQVVSEAATGPTAIIILYGR